MNGQIEVHEDIFSLHQFFCRRKQFIEKPIQNILTKTKAGFVIMQFIIDNKSKLHIVNRRNISCLLDQNDLKPRINNLIMKIR